MLDVARFHIVREFIKHVNGAQRSSHPATPHDAHKRERSSVTTLHVEGFTSAPALPLRVSAYQTPKTTAVNCARQRGVFQRTVGCATEAELVGWCLVRGSNRARIANMSKHSALAGAARSVWTPPLARTPASVTWSPLTIPRTRTPPAATQQSAQMTPSKTVPHSHQPTQRRTSITTMRCPHVQ